MFKRFSTQLAAVWLLIGLAGCNANTPPIERAYTARTTFNQMVTSINLARATNTIDGPTFDTLNDTYHEVAITLDDLDIAAVQAEASNTPIWINFNFKKQFDRAITQLNTLATKWALAKANKKPPSQ